MKRRSSFFLVLFLTSCTAFPPPVEWMDVKKKEQSNLPPPTPQKFEEALKKLTLEKALEIARKNSPTIIAARTRIDKARARLSEAESLAYPRLDARANYVRFLEAAEFRGRTSSNISGSNTRARFFTGRNTDIYSSGIDLNYPLFDGGMAYYSRKAAESAMAATLQEASEISKELDLQVSEVFLSILLSRGAVTIAEESLKFSQKQENQAEIRAEVGEGLRLDVLRFATRASERKLALNRARANQRIRRAILAELIGISFEDSVEVIDPAKPLSIPKQELLATAFEMRPEIHFFKARIAEARSRIAIEKSIWWPSVTFFGSYGFLSLDDLKLNQKKDEFQVGTTLSMNLFEGGASRARLSASSAEVEGLRHQLREVLLQIEREVKEAEIELEVSEENVEVSTKTLELSEEVLARETVQYQAGDVQIIDLMDAELQRTQSQLEHLRSKINFLMSQVRLIRAIGFTQEFSP